MAINMPAMLAAGAGGLLVWSGIRGASVTGTLKDLVSGSQPSGTEVQLLSAGDSGGSSGVPGHTNSAIANDAIKYQGAGYVWGGAPAKGLGNWDCSSFVNWVVGHDLKMAIPGFKAGTYTGATHGPATLQWLGWSGAQKISASQASAGDIVVGATHMGIVTGPGQYISAHDVAEGTSVSPLAKFPDAVRVFRRLR